MTIDNDLTILGARELAQRIAAGAASALDATDQYIARIEAVNPKLNAVVVKRYDEARAEARASVLTIRFGRCRDHGVGPDPKRLAVLSPDSMVRPEACTGEWY